MPRGRRNGLIVAMLAGAGSALVGWGCQTDSQTAGCMLAEQVAWSGDMLTLLPSVRMDRVRQSYVLIGAGPSEVRWAPIDATTGQLGSQQAATFAPAGSPVWYGLSGTAAPGDAVVVAVGRPASNGVDQEIVVQAQPADGSPGSPPGPVLATIPGGATPAPGSRPLVTMGSSRQGRAAGLAWIDAAQGAVTLALLDGAGQTIGSPSVAGQSPVIDCVAFQPGTGDLTLTFLKYDGVSNMPVLEIAEVGEATGVASTLALTLTSDNPGCPLVVPTDKGYSIAWQDKVGTWLGVYDSTTNRFFVYPAAGAVQFGGSDLQPPLAGFGPVGADYMMVFAKVGSTELWRLDSRGNRRPGVLAFPSQEGELGTVSSLPVAGTLFATYADYTATDAGVGAAGQRYFVQASCQ